MKRIFTITGLIAAYALILGIPFLFHPKQVLESFDRKLIILSPHPEHLKQEMEMGFKSWLEKNHQPKVGIEWLDTGGTSSQMKYVINEFKRNPKGIDIDLFFGGGTDPYLTFTKNKP